MPDEKRIRMTASERESLTRINLGLSFLLTEPQNLERRTRMIKKGKFWLGAARKALEKYTESAYLTVPPEQLLTIRRSIMETGYYVGVKCGATVNVNRTKEMGLVLPFDVITTLVNGCNDHCLTCALDTEGQRRCKLRKALDAIPNDNPDRDDGGCPYRNMI